MREKFYHSIVVTISLKHCRHDNLFIKISTFFLYLISKSSLSISTFQNIAIIRKKINRILKEFLKSHKKCSFHVFSFRD